MITEICHGVTEYEEGFEVVFVRNYESSGPANGKDVIRAINQGGHDSVSIDVNELCHWIKMHRPELLK